MALIKQVVPWFNKQEWEEVYNYAYSTDPELQRKAYQQMAVWRARVSNLSMGVECTQAFLHVRLCETKKKEDGSPAFEDIDLQPIYSTAMMRFLNHLQGFCNNTTSLYQMADRYGIPDWIVNIRHETAHGNKLPSLFLLRDASDFIYDWLDKNYWQKEMSKMMDLVVGPSKSFEKNVFDSAVEKLLDTWKCLKLYQLGGYTEVADIPYCEALGKVLSEIKDICSEHVEPRKKTYILLQKTSNYILDCIFQMLNIKSVSDKQYAENSLISKLLSKQSFLPSVKLKRKPTYKFLMKILMNTWKEVIVRIQRHGLLLNLLRALFEVTNDSSDPRSFIAALWIRYLVLSIKFRDTNSPMELSETTIDNVLKLISDSLSSPYCPSEVVDKIIKDSSEMFTQSLSLKPFSYQERNSVQQLVKEVLLSPSENTSVFIDNFLDLWEPPLEASNKYKLCRLVKLYTKEMNQMPDIEDTSEDILSLEMFLGDSSNIYDSNESLNETKQEVDEQMSVDNNDEGIWSRYSGNENWGKCALGRTPWQDKNFLHVSMLDN